MGKILELAQMSEDERERRVKKLPPWAREYIEHLHCRIEDLEDDAQDVAKAANFDDELGTLWTLLAARRMGCGDLAGFTRAERAARLVRVS